MGGRPRKPSDAATGDHAPAAAPTDLAALAEYGVGAYDPTTGLYEDYELPAGHPARPAGPSDRPAAGPSWLTVLEQWHLIEADLADLGIDVTARLLRRRTGRWLRQRISGVLSANTRTARALGLISPPPRLPRR